MGLATGQTLNILMSILGRVLLLVRFRGRPDRSEATTVAWSSPVEGGPASGGVLWRRSLFAFLLLFSLVMPSDWTQDVPARYGKRHAGLHHSMIYPKIDTSPASAQRKDGSKETPNRLTQATSP